MLSSNSAFQIHGGSSKTCGQSFNIYLNGKKKKKAYFNFFLNIEKYDQTSLGCILLNCYYFPSFIQIYTDVEKKMKIFKHAL